MSPTNVRDRLDGTYNVNNVRKASVEKVRRYHDKLFAIALKAEPEPRRFSEERDQLVIEKEGWRWAIPPVKRNESVGQEDAMKRTIRYVLGFALLGALIGACFPLFLSPRGAGTYGLPWWLDDYFGPLLVPLVITVPSGLFIGALTGLASAFSTGRLATVRCLLTITILAILVMSFFPTGKRAAA